MNYRVTLLVFLLCMAAVPPMAADNYMGGTIELGGSGVKITATTAAPAQPTATVPPVALSATGSLSVTTSPAGATLFVDGVRQGVTPATIPGLAPGSHTVLLRMDGYDDFTTTVTITAGQTATYTTGLSAAATPLPAHPTEKKTPGFTAAIGFAATGAILLFRKFSS